MYRSLLITALLSLALSTKVWAWGAEGHQTVAWVAEARLTPKTVSAVHSLVAIEGKEHLADVASWADSIRGSQPGLIAHSVRIPFQDDRYRAKKVCSKVGRCVIYGIDHSIEILRSDDASQADKLIALKFLIHYVGDIHQPLHAIKQTGSFPVNIGRKTTTLHTLWDRSVRYMKVPPKDLATELLSINEPVRQGDSITWAEESHQIAKHFIYQDNIKFAKGEEKIDIPKNYIKVISPVVRRQILFAGVRLANTLNQIFDH